MWTGACLSVVWPGYTKEKQNSLCITHSQSTAECILNRATSKSQQNCLLVPEHNQRKGLTHHCLSTGSHFHHLRTARPAHWNSALGGASGHQTKEQLMHFVCCLKLHPSCPWTSVQSPGGSSGFSFIYPWKATTQNWATFFCLTMLNLYPKIPEGLLCPMRIKGSKHWPHFFRPRGKEN